MKYVHLCICIFIPLLQNTYSVSNSYTGGWETDDSSMLAEAGPCNIDVIDVRTQSLSQSQFEDNLTIRDDCQSRAMSVYQLSFDNQTIPCYAFTKPVIIRGATDNTGFQKLCEKSMLLQMYGEKTVRLSSANTHSYTKRDVKLTQYVNGIMKPQTLDTMGNETFYWFGDHDYEDFHVLFDEYNPPPYKLPNLHGIYSFGVAAAGTGVPFHFHGPGFGEVIFGRKRWFMYPPDRQPAFNPDKTTLHWLMEEYPNLHPSDKPLECTINQGEIIYFADRWWHGTLNIDTSVFISTFLG